MSKRKKTSSKKRKYKFLKVIGRGIYRFFEFIFKIIDKIIITPVSKLILLIGNLLKSNNKPLDRLLNNKIFLIILSLILAFGAFFIVDSTANVIVNSTADVISNVPVNALYNEEAYVVEGLPETVDVILIGRKSDIYLTKQYPTTSIALDLSDKKPRNKPYELNLKYNGAISSVEYNVDPSVVSIMIYEKLSESRTITRELLNIDSLNTKYSITNVNFSMSEVYIKGKQDSLDEVAIVKALIDVKELANASTGTNTVKDIPLVAYNKQGERVNVEIVPSMVDATVEIASPHKEVVLKVVPEGTVVFGKAIESMTLNTTKVTIYGEEEILANINSIPVKINVNNLSKNTDFNVNIAKPNGIRDISTSSVVVKVTLTEITEKIVNDVPIETRNLSSDYIAQAATKEDSTVSVIVKGTAANLKNITKDDISAYVDLSGINESGEKSVKVQVTGSDLKLTYTPQTENVSIIIRRN